jgi:hypothetical protein
VHSTLAVYALPTMVFWPYCVACPLLALCRLQLLADFVEGPVDLTPPSPMYLV